MNTRFETIDEEQRAIFDRAIELLTEARDRVGEVGKEGRGEMLWAAQGVLNAAGEG